MVPGYVLFSESTNAPKLTTVAKYPAAAAAAARVPSDTCITINSCVALYLYYLVIATVMDTIK